MKGKKTDEILVLRLYTAVYVSLIEGVVSKQEPATVVKWVMSVGLQWWLKYWKPIIIMSAKEGWIKKSSKM